MWLLQSILSRFLYKGGLMRYLGLDIGDATIGIALSDPLGITAQGYDNYRRVSKVVDVDYLIDIICEYHVTKVVYGLPINMNGSIGPQAEKVKAFIKALHKKAVYGKRIDWQLEWVAQDERLTTAQAEKAMILAELSRKSRSQIVDRIAAQLILQQYLDWEVNSGQR